MQSRYFVKIRNKILLSYLGTSRHNRWTTAQCFFCNNLKHPLLRLSGHCSSLSGLNIPVVVRGGVCEDHKDLYIWNPVVKPWIVTVLHAKRCVNAWPWHCDTTVPPPSVEDIKLTLYLSANRGRPEERIDFFVKPRTVTFQFGNI